MQISNISDRPLIGFVEFAGMTNMAYIVWEEDEQATVDESLTGYPVIMVAKVFHDGVIHSL